MQIITKAIFYDEEKKQELKLRYTFDLLDVCNANEGENDQTVITDRSTGMRTNVKISFDKYLELVKKTFHHVTEIYE